MSNLSTAYADALFEIALEENIPQEILSQSALITQVVKENADPNMNVIATEKLQILS